MKQQDDLDSIATPTLQVQTLIKIRQKSIHISFFSFNYSLFSRELMGSIDDHRLIGILRSKLVSRSAE